MNCVIIKHYMCDIDGDYREVEMDNLNTILGKMRAYAKRCDKKLVYIILSNSPYGLLVDSDSYAEIEYTGELSAAEKSSYTDYLKALSMDEEYSARPDRVELHCTLGSIRFTKIPDEIIEV